MNEQIVAVIFFVWVIVLYAVGFWLNPKQELPKIRRDVSK